MKKNRNIVILRHAKGGSAESGIKNKDPALQLRRPQDDEHGFTLMEILVALVIFSIMATGFSRYVSERAKQTAYLADKTLAAIVASNTLSDMQISNHWPPVGHIRQQVGMADKQWQVAIDVQNTDHPTLRRLEVSVTLPEISQPLVVLTGFAGKN